MSYITLYFALLLYRNILCFCSNLPPFSIGYKGLTFSPMWLTYMNFSEPWFYFCVVELHEWMWPFSYHYSCVACIIMVFLFKFTPLFFVGFVLWLLEYYSCVSWLHEWLLLCGLHLIWYFLYRLLFYFSSMFYFLLIIFFSCNLVFDKRSSFRVLLLVLYYTFIF